MNKIRRVAVRLMTGPIFVTLLVSMLVRRALFRVHARLCFPPIEIVPVNGKCEER